MWVRMGWGAALLLWPGMVLAQEGSIAYAHTVRVDREMLEREIPEAMRARMEARRGGQGAAARGGGAPGERGGEVVLLFSVDGSLLRPVPRTPPEGRDPDAAPPAGARGGATPLRMRALAAVREAQPRLLATHVDFQQGLVAESRTFLGRTFLIQEERPSLPWRLTGEQAEFLGFPVQKATAQHGENEVEAWFTPQIPIPGGPGIYGGLPGMILVVSVDQGREQYSATSVSLAPVEEGVIAPPDEGQEVTREEFAGIVAERLEELQSLRPRGPR